MTEQEFDELNKDYMPRIKDMHVDVDKIIMGKIKCASKDYVNYLLDKQEYHNEYYTEYDIRQAFEKSAMFAFAYSVTLNMED